MSITPSTRRFLAIALIIFGTTLIFLATESWVGILLVILGISIELIGVAMRHK